MSRILRALSNKEIRIKEYRPANAVFNTNEYSPLEECCILDETIDPFEMFYKNQLLQNNWNELKKWLIQLQKFKGINQQGFSWGVAQEVLDKMQELEGNNENL